MYCSNTQPHNLSYINMTNVSLLVFTYCGFWRVLFRDWLRGGSATWDITTYCQGRTFSNSSTIIEMHIPRGATLYVHADCVVSTHVQKRERAGEVPAWQPLGTLASPSTLRSILNQARSYIPIKAQGIPRHENRRFELSLVYMEGTRSDFSFHKWF